MSDDCPIVQIHSNYDDRDRDIAHNRKLYYSIAEAIYFSDRNSYLNPWRNFDNYTFAWKVKVEDGNKYFLLFFKDSGQNFVWNLDQNVGRHSCRNSGREIRWPCLILYFECRHNNVNDLQMCTQTSFLFLVTIVVPGC